MNIFIFYCLLFIYVNMCIYIMDIFIESPYCYYYVDMESGFWVSIRISGIRGFGFGMSYHPNRCSMRFRVSGSGAYRLHPIRIRPLPSLRTLSWCRRRPILGFLGFAIYLISRTTMKPRPSSPRSVSPIYRLLLP
jgi:hypothetical protein